MHKIFVIVSIFLHFCIWNCIFAYPSRTSSEGSKDARARCPFADQIEDSGEDYLQSNMDLTRKLSTNTNHGHVQWAWQGRLESTSILIKARMSQGVVDGSDVGVLLWDVHGSESNGKWIGAKSVERYEVATIHLQDLKPNTQYHYVITAHMSMYSKGSKEGSLKGSFKTPQPEFVAQSFSFGFASCADNHSNSIIFDVIRNHHPLMFLHTGDLHYGNIESTDTKIFQDMYDQVMASERQSTFFRNVPIAYMWDDHDFGPNNADSSAIGREASIEAYLTTVPYYPLAAYKPGTKLNPKHLPSVYYSFAIGRIKFIVTDTSSSKVGDSTALGSEQLAWFKKELLDASKHYAQLFWVSTMPWVTPGAKWGAFVEEQLEIVKWITSHGIHKKLALLSGDAHMIAVDDGSYAPGGFPVFQAAALDAKPTSKGGPYSHGIWPGRGQYGWMDVVDDGTKVCYEFSGRRVNGEGIETELVRFNSCDPTRNSPRDTYFPSPRWIEKIWKAGKNVIATTVPGGEHIMVFFDGFRISFGMVMMRYVPYVVMSFVVFGFLTILRGRKTKVA